MYSLRRRLLILSLTTVIVCWLGTLIWAQSESNHEVEELFDATLAQTARTLFALIKHEYARNPELNLEAIENTCCGRHHYESKVAFVVYLPNGKRFHSISAPLFSKKEFQEKPEKRSHNRDFHNEEIEGYLWRVFSLNDDSGFFIQTGERYDVRNELTEEILFSLITPLLMLLPLLAFGIWFSIGHSLKPLEQLSHEILQRDFNQLHPLSLKKTPKELIPVLEAINILFRRLAKAFENERRFTSDAAHELRTPLAGIKTQVEVALRDLTLTLPENKQSTPAIQALHQALRGMERATHLVGQLLAMARMDAAQDLPLQKIDLYQLCVNIISEQMNAAQDKNIDLGLETPLTRLEISANEDALYLLLRNLVDNAIRYTPENGMVTIQIDVPHLPLKLTQPNAYAVYLRVIDNGIGIPENQRESMLSRFSRGANNDFTGSGLGLSIVQRITELHQASLHLETPTDGHGLQVTVALNHCFVFEYDF